MTSDDRANHQADSELANDYFAEVSQEDLGPYGWKFILALRSMLAEQQPPTVAPSETWVRLERGAGDAVIPHRRLRGLALAAGFGEDEITVYWVHYHDPVTWADEFDQARVDTAQGSFRRSEDPEGWVGAALDQIKRNLSAPLEIVRLLRPGDPRPLRTEVYLPQELDRDGRRRKVWTEGHRFRGIRWPMRRYHTQVEKESFSNASLDHH